MGPGLLEACDDPRLFGLELWPKQRELLEAIQAGPRLQVIAVGRRSGKTTVIAGATCLHSCLFRPDLDARVRRGETRYAVVVAVRQDQARLLVSSVRAIVEGSELLAPLLESSTEYELRFRLPSGARTALSAFPTSSRSGRGWPISCLVLDEAAHMIGSDEADGHQTAAKVYEALVPATAQFGDGARVIVASTPYGDQGMFAELYQRSRNGELEDAVAHHASTAEMNPTIDEAFLRREEQRDPDGFKGEYLATFLGSGLAYLDFDRFEVVERAELHPDDVIDAVAGLDPAFSSDPFGCAIVARPRDERRRLVLAWVGAWKARKPKSFEDRRRVEDEILAQVAEVCHRYRVRRVVTDQHAANAVVHRLQGDGLNVGVEAMTATTKTAAFGELRARLYDGSLEVYAHAPLLAEMRRLRSKYTAGTAQVINPRVGGSHGDQVQALALTVREHAKRRPPTDRNRGDRAPGHSPWAPILAEAGGPPRRVDPDRLVDGEPPAGGRRRARSFSLTGTRSRPL